MKIKYAGIDLGFDTVKLAVNGDTYDFPSLAKDAIFYNAKGYELRAKKIYEDKNKDKE